VEPYVFDGDVWRAAALAAEDQVLLAVVSPMLEATLS
jgi:hypothetical protein